MRPPLQTLVQTCTRAGAVGCHAASTSPACAAPDPVFSWLPSNDAATAGQVQAVANAAVVPKPDVERGAVVEAYVRVAGVHACSRL